MSICPVCSNCALELFLYMLLNICIYSILYHKKRKKKKKKERFLIAYIVEIHIVYMLLTWVLSVLVHRDLGVDLDNVTGKNSSEEKKKKKKKKKSTTQEGEGKATVDQTVSAVGNKEVEEKQSEVKSSQVRTFANGLVIEELQMGKPDGKRASPGKQVSLCLILVVKCHI